MTDTPRIDELISAVWQVVAGDPGWPELSPAARGPLVADATRVLDPLAGDTSVAAVVDAIVARANGLGALEALFRDVGISEVMVNGDGTVWIERGGVVTLTDLVMGEDEVLRLVERIAAPLGLRADRSSPVVDARLADGSRVHAVLRPLAVDGPCLTIRRFTLRAVSLDAFAPVAIVELLRWAVCARANIVVSGGTSSGKTTLLNALAACISGDERVVTIEDTAELRLPGRHVVRLEAREPNAEGAGGWTIRDLVRNALRMRPDRIIVGEVRGPEALDMLQAMNTGHEGSLSTCHANGPDDALRRLETMIMMGNAGLPLAAVREQLRSSVDLVVQVARTPGDGRRRVVAVHEVEHAAGSSGGCTTRKLADACNVVADAVRCDRAGEGFG